MTLGQTSTAALRSLMMPFVTIAVCLYIVYPVQQQQPQQHQQRQQDTIHPQSLTEQHPVPPFVCCRCVTLCCCSRCVADEEKKDETGRCHATCQATAAHHSAQRELSPHPRQVNANKQGTMLYTMPCSLRPLSLQAGAGTVWLLLCGGLTRPHVELLRLEPIEGGCQEVNQTRRFLTGRWRWWLLLHYSMTMTGQQLCVETRLCVTRLQCIHVAPPARTVPLV